MTGRPTTVFFGTPEFAVPSLEAVARLGDVPLVVTQPDRPAGRGRRTRPGPVKVRAGELGCEVLQPRRTRDPDLWERLRAVRADLFFVTAYGLILPREILEIPDRGCVNLHASLLPRHRGAAPIHRAVMEGDRETGLTLMLMDEGMDTGPVLATWRTEIDAEETAGTLHDRLMEASGGFIEDALPRWLAGEITPRPQDDGEATLAPPLEKDEGVIDWNRPAEEVARRIRGTTPWPGARTWMGDSRLCVHSVRLPGPGDAAPPGGPPGSVFVADGRMKVRCAEGWVIVERLQAACRRAMSTEDWLRGCREEPCGVLAEEPTST